MSSFRDLVKSVNNGTGVTAKTYDDTEDDREKGKEVTPFRDLVKSVNSGETRVGSTLKETDVVDWFDKVDKVSRTGYDFLNKSGYKRSDAGLTASINSYLDSANLVGQYLRSNKNAFENYDDLMQAYNDSVGYLRTLQTGISDSEKFFSQFADANEYDAAVKASQEYYDAWGHYKDESGYKDTAKSGWDKYLADIQAEHDQAKQEDDSKSWFEKIDWNATSIMPSGIGMPGGVGNIVNSYREDKSYLRPQENWTQEQKDMYGYLYSTDRKKADEYAQMATAQNNSAEKQKKMQAVTEWSTQNGLTMAAGTLAAIATMPLSLVDTMDYLMEYTQRGTITPKSHILPGELSSVITSAIAETLNEKSGTISEKIPIIGNKGLGDAYGLAVSIAESSLFGSAFGEQGTYLVYFGSAFANTFLDAKQRNVSDSKALTTGFLHGLAEAAFEAYSIDKLFNGEIVGTTLSKFWKHMLMQGGFEAYEEAMTSITDEFADLIVLQDKSTFNMNVQKYMADGLSEKDAKRKAWMSFVDDVIYDAVGGFISGGVHTGMVDTFNAVKINGEYKNSPYAQDTRALVDEGLAIDPNNATAKKMQGKLDAGKTLSGLDIYNLIDANEAGIRASEHDAIKSGITEQLNQLGATGDNSKLADALAKKAAGEDLTLREKAIIRSSQYGNSVDLSRAGEYVDAMYEAMDAQEAENAAKADAQTAEPASAAAATEEKAASDAKVQTSAEAVQRRTAAQSQTAAPQTIQQAAQKYGDQSRAVQAIYTAGQDVDKFISAVDAAIDWGKSGVPRSVAMNSSTVSYLTETQRGLAYDMGAAAAEQAAKARPKTGSGNTARKAGTIQWIGISGSDQKQLNSNQKTAIRLMRRIVEATGVNLVLYNSKADNSGRFTESEGKYTNNTIYVDINAGLGDVSDVGKAEKYTLLRTFSHEFTHFMEHNAKADYNAFRKLVFDTMQSRFDQGNASSDIGTSVDDLIQRKLDLYREADRTDFTYEEASREVVADAMVDILQDATFMEKLYNENRTVFQKIVDSIKEFMQDIKDYFASVSPSNKVEAELLKDNSTLRYLEEIVDAYDKLALTAISNYQSEADVTGGADISNEAAFTDSEIAVQNQIRPPYSDGSKAFNEFAEGLSEEARKTFDMFYGFYQKSRITNAMGVKGKPVKAINISSVFLRAQDWNAMLAQDSKWAAAAKELADFLPDNVRTAMHMNADGTLTPVPLEEEFKMQKSLAQRLVDALPFEMIDAEYQLGDKKITLPAGKARQSVGGEAYRRAVLAETRKLYADGKLRKVGIGTMSKDRWGSLGFLAANGKTGASGDFTTVCPQMMFNRGCWYCYRRAAMESGVNNKLVAQQVWYTGEILRIRDADIEALNKNGGLRIQSFGDWMPHFSAMLADVLYDAELRGLQIKIITKEPSMINYIASQKEQGIGKNLYFNLSADYTIEKAPQVINNSSESLDAINPERPFMRDEGGQMWWKRAMTVEEANRYRQKYPWVNTRIVAATQEEFIRGLKDPTVDVVTGYHGNIRSYERVDSTTGQHTVNVEALGDAGMPRFAFNPVSGQWVTEYEGKTATHKALAQAIADNNLQMEYYTKTCCITGRCATCNGKCGALARDFNVKNATNRDTESVQYWREQMQYAIEPEFGDMTVNGEDSEDGVQYSIRELDGSYIPVVDTENDTRDAKAAEAYLKTLVDKSNPFATILSDAQPVYIGSDLPGEYRGSEYTQGLRSNLRSVKMQAATNLDEMLLLAENGAWQKNVKKKHMNDAKYGWYRYDTKFAVPVLDMKKAVDHYTVYSGTLLIRNDADGKSYLYDLIGVKKEKVISASSFSAKERSEVFAPKPSHEQYTDADLKSQEQNQVRESNLSNRDVLRMAAADVRKKDTYAASYEDRTGKRAWYGKLTDAERSALDIFQKRLDRLDELENQKAALVEQRTALEQDPEGRQRGELTKVRNNIKTLNEMIAKADADVNSAEIQPIMKRVLQQARNVVEKDSHARHMEELRDYKAKRNDTEEARKYRGRITNAAMQLSEWMRKNSDKAHIPEVLKAPVGELLTSIDFSSKRLLKRGELTKADQKFGANIVAIRKILENQQSAAEETEGAVNDAGAYLDISGENRQFLKDLTDVIAQNKGVFTINSMTTEQLHAFAKFLENLKTAISQANKVLANARYKDMPAMAHVTMKHFETMGNASPSASNGVRNYVEWKNGTPYYVFKRFGPAGEALFDGFTKGWEKFAFNAKEIINFSEAAYNSGEVRKWRSTIHSIDIKSGAKIQMTTAQIMELYCLLGREQAMKHIQAGGIRIGNIEQRGGRRIQDVNHHHLTDGDISKILSKLGSRETAVAKKMQQFMAKRGAAWGNEISMARFGYNFYTEGDSYFPIKTDANGRPMRDTDENGASMFRLLNLSASKSLNPNANNALIVGDLFDTFSDHMSDMAKLNALGLPLLDAIKWYNFTERTYHENGDMDEEGVKKSMEQAFGAASGNYFKTLLKDINGAKESGDRSGSIGSKLMSNYKIAAVGANLRVALLQPTSYVRAMAVLKPSSMLEAMLFKRNAYDEAMKYSGTAVWKSLGYFDTDIARSMRSQIEHDETAMDKIKEFSMSAAELGDKRTWGRLWVACKLEAKSRNSSLSGEALMQATADIFRETIYATQVMDSTLTRSEIMRGSTRYDKIVSAFGAEPTLSFNLLMDAFSQFNIAKRQGGSGYALKKTGGIFARAAATYALSAAASAVIESIADAFRDDDDYESFLDKFMQAFLGENGFMDGNLGQDLTILGKIPEIKDIIGQFRGQKRSDMSIASIESITNAFNIWKETYQLEKGILEKATSTTWNGKMTLYGKVYKTLQALSQLSGVAASNMTRDVVAIWNTAIGSEHPELKVKTYDPGEKNSIKYAYQDGLLTEEEAIRELMDKGVAKDQNEAYFTIKGWEGGTKYDAVYDAMYDGKDIREATADLTSHGVSQKDVDSKVKSQVKKWYQETEEGERKISKSQATSMLKRYTDMSDDEITTTINKWSSKVVTGISYDDIKEEFKSGNITAKRAIEMYKLYGGLSEEDAANKVKVYEWQNAGFDIDDSNRSVITDYETFVEPAGIDKQTYYDAYLFYKDSGEAGVAYSKTEETIPYIASIPGLTPSQRTALALCWWSEKTVDKYKTW